MFFPYRLPPNFFESDLTQQYPTQTSSTFLDASSSSPKENTDLYFSNQCTKPHKNSYHFLYLLN
jgi:hypothetical protein